MLKEVAMNIPSQFLIKSKDDVLIGVKTSLNENPTNPQPHEANRNLGEFLANQYATMVNQTLWKKIVSMASYLSLSLMF